MIFLVFQSLEKNTFYAGEHSEKWKKKIQKNINRKNIKYLKIKKFKNKNYLLCYLIIAKISTNLTIN